MFDVGFMHSLSAWWCFQLEQYWDVWLCYCSLSASFSQALMLYIEVVHAIASTNQSADFSWTCIPIDFSDERNLYDSSTCLETSRPWKFRNGRCFVIYLIAKGKYYVSTRFLLEYLLNPPHRLSRGGTYCNYIHNHQRKYKYRLIHTSKF